MDIDVTGVPDFIWYGISVLLLLKSVQSIAETVLNRLKSKTARAEIRKLKAQTGRIEAETFHLNEADRRANTAHELEARKLRLSTPS